MPRLADGANTGHPTRPARLLCREREGCAMPTRKPRKPLVSSTQLEEIFRVLGLNSFDLWAATETKLDEAKRTLDGARKVLRATLAREAQHYGRRSEGGKASGEGKRERYDEIRADALKRIERGQEFHTLAGILGLKYKLSPTQIRVIIKPLRPERKKAKVS